MLTEQVSACRAAADCVIVFVNWGAQSGFSVSSVQQETAKILCAAGADVVIGTGAKVIQKIEWIRDETTGHQTLCAYSLGNILCTMEMKENLLGGMLSFEVEKTGEGKSLVKNVTFLPTVIHYDKNGENICVYLLSSYTEALFSHHGAAEDPAAEYAWFRRTVSRYIPKEFLPTALRT